VPTKFRKRKVIPRYEENRTSNRVSAPEAGGRAWRYSQRNGDWRRWQREAQKFASSLPVMLHHGPGRERSETFAQQAAEHPKAKKLPTKAGTPTLHEAPRQER